jgi:predicted nucleic acid-binding protein
VSIVVSDTSPIRALNHLELLSVLGLLFDQVFVPPAVVQELGRITFRLKPVDLTPFQFIDLRAPQDAGRVQRFLQTLDQGESEALSLALEVDAEALLIDELAGRSVAIQEGMSVIGTLGILSRAKMRGHIMQVRPLLDQLVDELDFHVSNQLRDEILRAVGE